MRTAFHLPVTSLLLAAALQPQTSRIPVTTVARVYQSPDGAFSLDVPAGWTARKEEGSNQVSFVLNNVSVSVGATPSDGVESVEGWMKVSQSVLKEQCPAAQIQSEGKAMVAGASGMSFTVYCPGPLPPTTVRESAALVNGKIFTFNITSRTLELTALEADIDSMAKSFRGVDRSDSANGAGAAGYQDPQHRFSLDVPAGWTLTQRGENGQEGVILIHNNSWIRVTAGKDDRPEELVNSFSKQSQRDYMDLRQGKHGRDDIHGYRALTDCFTGVDAKGTPCFFGITAIDMGRGHVLSLLWSAEENQAAQVNDALQKLKQSIWF